MHFLCETIFMLPEIDRVDALKVLAKYLKTVFNEVHFIVNLLHQNSIEKNEDVLERWLDYSYFR